MRQISRKDEYSENCILELYINKNRFVQLHTQRYVCVYNHLCIISIYSNNKGGGGRGIKQKGIDLVKRVQQYENVGS